MARLLPLFSPGSFAPTCLPDHEHRAPKVAGWQLLPCECGAAKLVRIRRPLWLRLLPRLRLYQCRRCWAKFLHPRVGRKTPYGYVYRPSVTVSQALATRRR